MTTRNAHILACPFAGPGHIIPLLDLTQKFLTHGLTITILVTPTNLPLLQPLLSAHPSSLHPLVLSFPETQTPSPNRLISNMRGMRQLQDPIVQWFKSHPSPPVAIISDFFMGWTHTLASELGVPRLMFSPSGALAVAVNTSLWSDLPEKGESDDQNLLISFPKIPNNPTFPWWQLSHIYRGSKKDDPDFDFFRNCMRDNMASWGLVFNSFTELERVYIDHFRKETGHDRVWAVGPLLPPDDDVVGTTNRGGSSSVEVITWLDGRRDHSVVYVSFGSRGVLTRGQMEVLAAALESSGVSFILCLKEPRDRQVAGDGLIPDGFEDRVAGRGFIVKGWAPQVAILRHRAVGAFVTHCGWNSTLEGLSAGVMMLTWPLGADQFSNAMLLVDQLGVGVRVGEGNEKIPDLTELTRLLAESVSGTRPERERAMEMRRAASAAVKGGSSERDFDELVRQLNELRREE